MQTKDGVNWAHDVFSKDGRTLIMSLWGVIQDTELVITRALPGGRCDVIARVPYRELGQYLERKQFTKGVDGVWEYRKVIE
jgi:hypothetical protein